MPWVAVASAAYGAYQSIKAGQQRKKAEAELEKQANEFKPNASILDFYNKALSKYNPNPYQSQSFQQQNNQIQRNLATGINAAGSKRLGLGAIAGQVQQANDASARAVGNAEMQGAQDLARLGQASGMKTQEQQKKFDMLYNLQAQKAGAYAQTQNSGLQNVFNGLSSAASMYSGDGSELFGDGSRGLNRRISNMDRVPRAF